MQKMDPEMDACDADDQRPIDSRCTCPACKYSRAALHSALCLGLPAAATLVSLHNVTYMQQLTLDMRCAMRDGRFPEWVQAFMLEQYPDKAYPEWVIDALRHVHIELL